jgi:sugar phosphate isomerase/epimerase
MGDLKIAVMEHSLRLPIDEGLRAIADMGVPGVHLHPTGEWTSLIAEVAGRREILRTVRSFGLELSALVGWGGEVDLGEQEGQVEAVAKARAALEWAADLGCRIWVAHVGVMPIDTASEQWQRFRDALGQIARHGETIGAALAVETGPEPPFLLRQMLDEIGSSGIGANYDPANLILWPPGLAKRSGQPYRRETALELFQPNEGPLVLGRRIVHTHAKDALVHEDGHRQEVPLGEGWVDWPRYVANLKSIGYQGYFAIEREVGGDPVGDIRRAVEFLRML